MRFTAWFVRVHTRTDASNRSADENAHTLWGTNARYPGRCGHHHAERDTAVVCAWQFVLEIDTVLFACFAPGRLKGALAKSAELVVASLPTFHGLDLAPVLKLIAALTMVGCLVGTIVMPQNSLLDAARVTLCGTRRVRVCSFVRGARCSAPFRRTQADRSTGRGVRPSSANRSGST